MKFRVRMRTPEVLDKATRNAVSRTIDGDLYDAAIRQRIEVGTMEAERICNRWFSHWGERVTLEIDTEAGTCTVVERGK